MEKLRIMSNNIWFSDDNKPAWAEMGLDCSAVHRAPGLFRVYEETQPDLIGLQECTAKMAHLLMTQFSQKELPYALLWGRNTPIVYRRDKFELVDSEAFIYPEEVPGIQGAFNDLKTKSYCIAVLRLKDSGQLLIFSTTHLWYKSGNPEARSYQPGSDAARAYQLGLLMDRLDALQARYQCPAVVVGDFNTYYATAAVQAALARGFEHAHDVAVDHVDETRGMHYCYADGFNTEPDAGGFARSIDHILIRGANTGFVRRFERFSPAYYMPLSDHFPVWIDTEL